MNALTQPAPPIAYLPANAQGRDFVVGDLHGCRSMLERLLTEVRFDPAVDRLLSVGDLVDRGPDSMGCLALLEEPWFHAVRGNHETLLLEFTWDAMNRGLSLPKDDRHTFLQNGGEWIFEQYDAGRMRLSDALIEALHRVRRLPFILVVGVGERRFHLVHADLHDAARPEQVSRNIDIDDLAEGWRDMDVTTLHPEDFPTRAQRWVWSRVLMGWQEKLRLPKSLPVLATTYCGHTIAPGVRRALSHVCLDTGAFIAANPGQKPEGHGLSLIEAGTGAVSFIPAPDGPVSRFMA